MSTAARRSSRNNPETGLATIGAMEQIPTTMRDFFFEEPHFKETWDQFEHLKDAMLKEPSQIMKQFDEDFKRSRCLTGFPAGQAENPLERMERSLMFPRKWMMPALTKDMKNQLDIYRSGHDHEVIRLKQNENELEVTLDTSHYRPDELKVTTFNGVVQIEGKHEETTPDGKTKLTRQFSRRYTLPEGARSEHLTSNLSGDGVLVVRSVKEAPRNVHIDMDRPIVN